MSMTATEICNRTRVTLKASVNFLEVAAVLAHMNDKEQAEFFNVFSAELTSVCETKFKLEMQCLLVRDLLDGAAKQVVETLACSEKS